MHTVVVRPGVIEFESPTEIEFRSKEIFFGESQPRILRRYGLIFKQQHQVSVLHQDDGTDNMFCLGLIIPIGCVRAITYFTEDYSDDLTTLPGDDHIN